MSTWYYGIPYGDESTIIAMYVGKNFFDPEEALKKHVECAKIIIENLDDITDILETIRKSLLNKRVLRKLGKVINAIKKAYTPELLFYTILCILVNIEPKIIDEYTLFEYYRDKLGRNVVVSGEEL